MPDQYVSVRGQCPMGCGPTLFLADGGHITCCAKSCPRPDAVATLLDERETEHVVQFDDTGFTVLHPLRERLDDTLMRCELHLHCASLSGPPGGAPGRYRARSGGGAGWTFDAIKEPTR